MSCAGNSGAIHRLGCMNSFLWGIFWPPRVKSRAVLLSGHGCGWARARCGLFRGISLAVFALILTRVDAAWAGRAYAAYGGVSIVASLAWMWLVEGSAPDRWDALGAAVRLPGAAVILLGPRGR